MIAYVVTGMSGAGKSMVVKQLEDMGFFCVDNIPPSLIPTFIEICRRSGERMARIALVADIRGGELLNELMPSLDSVRLMGVTATILYLEASDATLVKRYKESRRSHPLAPQGRVLTGIEAERAAMEAIKRNSTYIIDTSNFTVGRLRTEVERIVGEDAAFTGIVIDILTFGYKHGLPLDCDLVLDVRFTPNPFYEPSMKELTGMDARVSDYVFGFAETAAFMEKLIDMLEFLVPYYRREGKSQLVIGIGCTGGRHRSVAIGAALRERLERLGHRAVVEHRDIGKDARGAGRT